MHVVTLLDFLSRAAVQDADPGLEAFPARWASSLRVEEQAIRAAAVALADDRDLAVRPSVPGAAGKLGHGAASLVGIFGEWFDRRAARSALP